MTDTLLRDRLITLVNQIRSSKGTQEEQDIRIDMFEQQVPHPEACDLIFYPHLHGLGDHPHTEDIVDAALSYRPIQL